MFNKIMAKNELLDKFFKLSPQEQREVLNKLIDLDWSDEIDGDLHHILKDYEV